MSLTKSGKSFGRLSPGLPTPAVRPAARAKARRTPVDADDDAALAVWQPGQQQIALKAWDEGEA